MVAERPMNPRTMLISWVFDGPAIGSWLENLQISLYCWLGWYYTGRLNLCINNENEISKYIVTKALVEAFFSLVCCAK